jgi:hypothetical protein
MDALAQTALLVSLTSFSLGFATLARNVRNKLFLHYAIACTVVSAWALFYFISTVWPNGGWYGYHLSLNAWLAPVSLLFIQSMMRIERWLTSRVLFYGSLVLCLAMTVMVLFGLERHELIKNIIYFTPSLIVVQIVILMIFDRHLNPVVGVRRRFFLYAATLLVLLTCTVDHVPGIWIGIPIFGNFALTIFIFFLSQAVTQHRLLNVTSLLSRFLVVVTVAVLLAAVFSLVRSWAHELALFFLNSFIAAFFLLTLLEPIRAAVRFVIDKLITHHSEAFRNDIDATLQELALVVNPRDSLNVFENLVARVLRPNRILFYVHSSDPKILRRERLIGEAGEIDQGPQEIPKHHPIFDALANAGAKPGRASKVLLDQMLEDEIERMAGESAKRRYSIWRDAIHGLGGNIVFPFKKDGRILGIAVLDVRNPPEEYGSNWSVLREMEPVADRVAELLEKSSVFDRE